MVWTVPIGIIAALGFGAVVARSKDKEMGYITGKCVLVTLFVAMIFGSGLPLVVCALLR